jgi:NAD-dependent DNA ligase
MSYGRLIGRQRNRFAQGCGSLMGIAQGLVADQQLNDAEIRFLSAWLHDNEELSAVWPGDVLFGRVKDVLADGVITDTERTHLVETLEKICGGEMEETGAAVNQLAFDDVSNIAWPGKLFCITGDFVYGPRDRVQVAIEQRGGLISKGVTKKLEYLVVGLRGSEEWKHGSYGTKIEKAIQYKRSGQALVIVREDAWTKALQA